MSDSPNLRHFQELLASVERNEADEGPYMFNSDGSPAPLSSQFGAEISFKLVVAQQRNQIDNSPGYDQLRTYLLTEWNEELKANVIPNVCAELVRRGHAATVGAAERITLEETARILHLPVKIANQADRPSAAEMSGDQIPHWIKIHFRQQQYKLLKTLWNAGDVPQSILIQALSLCDSRSPTDSLRRRKSETNKGLAQKAKEIGALWEIRERTYDSIMHYYLQRSST